MANERIKVGIVGCGTIGTQLAEAIEKEFSGRAELLALCDINNGRAEALKAILSLRPEILPIDELIKACDLIIEAASAKISFAVAEKALQHNKDVMIMSVGGILERHQELFSLAQTKNCRIYLPSGALCGLDAVKSAAMANIEKVTLITRKPMPGLAGAPYIIEQKIDLSKITDETVIFEGNASDAVKGFPKNVNVCAALSLAGIGAQKTRVKIVTSPEYKTNIHEIQLEGDFGKLVARTENLPTPTNPKTSFLASLSAIATLKSILDVVKIGT